MSTMVARNSGALLQKLRVAMKTASPAVQAYIVPSEDAHMSEYIASCDSRRAFISNFTGSSGLAVITETKAALWTDGRYFLQASEELDQHWTLMKMGLPDTPSQAAWLKKELAADSKVGVDPKLISQRSWELMLEEFECSSITLTPLAHNLIDSLWPNQPPRPTSPAFIQPLQYSGLSWKEKVKKVRKGMTGGVGVMVVAALDDVAWLLNLRGSDVTYNPVFFAYVFLTHHAIHLCIEEKKLTPEVRSHLGIDNVNPADDFKVILTGYDDAVMKLQEIMQSCENKVSISPLTNTALFNVVPKHRQEKVYSQISVMKAVKNDVEMEGMKECHVRDGVALCEFLCWLEKEVMIRDVSEIEAADYAEECRKKQDLYVSLSFDSISSTGANASIIHYKPSPTSNKVISPNELFLFDSGAQYRDGTTDVTRTVHFKEPTQFEKECFTMVLKGHIALEMAVFPNGCKGMFLDCLARQYLWKSGLDYRHGTSHGVGSFLNVHEGPMGIAQKVRKEDIALKKGMVLSNEPGYYEDGKFGIRIENLFCVTDKDTLHNYQNTGFLTFKSLTLVPMQTKLMCKDLLTPDEIAWVNQYHQRVRLEVGEQLKKSSGLDGVLEWLQKQTMEL